MRKKSDTCFLFSWQIENPNAPDENGGTPSYDLPLKDNFWCSIPLAFRHCQILSSNSWYSMLGVQNLSKSDPFAPGENGGTPIHCAVLHRWTLALRIFSHHTLV